MNKKKMNKDAFAAGRIAVQFRATCPKEDLTWLTLVRHGETDLNVGKRIAGQLELGDYGAELTAGARRSARYHAWDFQLIATVTGGFQHQLVSPLQRAQETARLCLAQVSGVPDPVLVPDLAERGMGALVLRPKNLHQRFFSDPSLVPPTDGLVSDSRPESFSMFSDRVSLCLRREVFPRLRTGNLVMISHQYTTAVVESVLFGWGLEETMEVGRKVPNCAPILIGLDRTTLRPVVTGLCVIR
jgi:broad specificity phosphatase PhoE